LSGCVRIIRPNAFITPSGFGDRDLLTWQNSKIWSAQMNRPVAFGLGILTVILACALLIYGLGWLTGTSSPNILYLLFALLLAPLGGSIYWIAEVNLELKHTARQAFLLGICSIWFLLALARLLR
jgi:hypothetical protein